MGQNAIYDFCFNLMRFVIQRVFFIPCFLRSLRSTRLETDTTAEFEIVILLSMEKMKIMINDRVMYFFGDVVRNPPHEMLNPHLPDFSFPRLPEKGIGYADTGTTFCFMEKTILV